MTFEEEILLAAINSHAWPREEDEPDTLRSPPSEPTNERPIEVSFA
jgi:hypothetical protein